MQIKPAAGPSGLASDDMLSGQRFSGGGGDGEMDMFGRGASNAGDFYR